MEPARLFGAQHVDSSRISALRTEAERIQREMARMILKCSPKMTNEAVLGELGWWTLKGRRDLLRLKYYGKIVKMGEDRLVKQVYVESRKRLEEGKQSKWCADKSNLA